MTDKPGLYNHEAEAALLGCLLLEPKLIPDATDLVSPDDMHSSRHAVVYEAITGIVKSGGDVSMVSLHDRLKSDGLLEEVGGLDYLVDLTEACPGVTLMESFARQVKEKAQKRHLRRLLDDERRRTETSDSIVDQLETLLSSLLKMEAEHGGQHLVQTIGEVASTTVAQSRERAASRVSTAGISWGTRLLDEATDGLHPGQMTILAARPSMGKSAYAMWMAEHAAANGSPALFFSVEMSAAMLANRLLSSQTGINSSDIRRSRILAESEWHQLDDAVGCFQNMPLYICDQPGLSVSSLSSTSRRMVARHGVELIVVDYLQLLNPPQAQSREREVSMMSQQLKLLARDLEVPILVLSQLSRGPEQREDKRPKLSDLRDSGSLEQDADVVAFLYREEYYHRGKPEWLDTAEGRRYAGVCEVIVAKQRMGPTGRFPIGFDERRSRFAELDPSHPVWN